MIDDPEALASLFADTLLAGRSVLALPILETGQQALALPIALAEVEAAWRVARALLPQTQRWPIATLAWSGQGGAWSQTMAAADLFSRFYYEEEPNVAAVSPLALCQRAHALRGADVLAPLASLGVDPAVGDAEIGYELARMQATWGIAPPLATVKAAQITTEHDLQRFLLDWELAQGLTGDPELGRQPWYGGGGETAALLFLPTSNGWESLAYLHWYGALNYGTPAAIALGRSWQQRFGAELVAHYGTMLQCLVGRPPASIELAWPLAQEHEAAAPCTLILPGIALRDYARGLVGWDRWFLHDRP